MDLLSVRYPDLVFTDHDDICTPLFGDVDSPANPDPNAPAALELPC